MILGFTARQSLPSGGCGFAHTQPAAAGAESAPLATEGNQVLKMAGFFWGGLRQDELSLA